MGANRHFSPICDLLAAFLPEATPDLDQIERGLRRKNVTPYAAEVKEANSTSAFRADLRQTRGRNSAGVPENARADFSIDDWGE